MQPRERAQNSAQEKPRRAALYMRVSTVHQVDKDSLPMQRQELTAYCEYVLGIKDYSYFEDAGYSGKNVDRPAYQKMMGQMRNGLFTHLVVWKIDRISRNLLDFANMYDELKKLGVTFISKNEQFDTSNAMGEAMLKIILVFAELERQMTSERVEATMINRASNGLWNGGRVPYGYDYDKESKTFSVNEDEAAAVRRLFALYDKNHSIVKTCHALNAEGYRTHQGNEIQIVSVWSILRNPWYKGTYRYNYYKYSGRQVVNDPSEWIVIEDHHAAIIDAETFDRMQGILDVNARFRNEPGRITSGKNVHVFSGLLWCDVCGYRMESSPGRIRASGYRPSKYGCPGLRKSGTCGGKYISDPVIGEFLLNYILHIMNAQKSLSEIGSPEQLERFLLQGSTFRKIAHIESGGLNDLFDMLCGFSEDDSVLLAKPKAEVKDDSELKKLRADLKKQERALERLNHLYLYAESEMSDQEFLLRKRQIVDNIEQLNEAIGVVTVESWDRRLSDEDFLEQASTFLITQQMQDKQYIYYPNLAENTDPAVLQGFFRSVLDNVRIKGNSVMSITFRNGLKHSFIYKESANT